jgi:hypothetical protein
MWQMVPLPQPTFSPRRYKLDDWKWSLFLSREVVKGLELVGQAVNDHLRL